jgi:hypothetical protein
MRAALNGRFYAPSTVERMFDHAVCLCVDSTPPHNVVSYVGVLLTSKRVAWGGLCSYCRLLITLSTAMFSLSRERVESRE